jgi:hypothetical protein
MNGYLTFLRGLSEYQQKAQIAYLVFKERWGGSSMEEDILKVQPGSTFSESLGVGACSWEFDLKHYAEEPDLFGTPVFCGDQCTAPFSFRYQHLGSNLSLVITGIAHIGDDGRAMIGTLRCLSDQEKSGSRRRLELAGIDPDTLETVSHNVEVSRRVLYLDYLRALMPQQRRDAIFELAWITWGTASPPLLDHAGLAAELAWLGIWHLGIADKCHAVGPVEFKEGRCTAPLTYPLYGEGEASKYGEGGLGYFVEVHILAGIGNKPGAAGGDISIQDLWWRIESIDDPQDNAIPLIVP